MKNIITILLIISCITSYAQKKKSKLNKKESPTWFYLELKGGGGTSLFSNKNISNDKQIDMYKLGFNPVFGVALGAHIIDGLAFQIEKNWNTISQKYSYKNNLPDRSYSLKTSDLGFFIRGTRETGSFVGAGFKMSNITNATGDSLFFKPKINFLHFELGGPLWQNNMFDINLNLRFGYCITDIVDNKLFQPGAYTVYPSYSPTHPITVQAMIGFSWHIGYFATSNCKHKGFILFTN